MFPERPLKFYHQVQTISCKLHFGGVPAIAGVGAGDMAAFGVTFPLPACDERFADRWAAWIFLRRAPRRDLADSMTIALILALVRED